MIWTAASTRQSAEIYCSVLLLRDQWTELLITYLESIYILISMQKGCSVQAAQLERRLWRPLVSWKLPLPNTVCNLSTKALVLLGESAPIVWVCDQRSLQADEVSMNEGGASG